MVTNSLAITEKWLPGNQLQSKGRVWFKKWEISKLNGKGETIKSENKCL